VKSFPHPNNNLKQTKMPQRKSLYITLFVPGKQVVFKMVIVVRSY